ncbi:hypothetical protein NPIL_537481, partial [Nephila pilipes]
AHGEMLRPIQRLFPPEITCQIAEDVEAKVQKGRGVPVAKASHTPMISPVDPTSQTGRSINEPKRLDL